MHAAAAAAAEGGVLRCFARLHAASAAGQPRKVLRGSVASGVCDVWPAVKRGVPSCNVMQRLATHLQLPCNADAVPVLQDALCRPTHVLHLFLCTTATTPLEDRTLTDGQLGDDS